MPQTVRLTVRSCSFLYILVPCPHFQLKQARGPEDATNEAMGECQQSISQDHLKATRADNQSTGPGAAPTEVPSRVNIPIRTRTPSFGPSANLIVKLYGDSQPNSHHPSRRGWEASPSGVRCSHQLNIRGYGTGSRCLVNPRLNMHDVCNQTPCQGFIRMI